MPKAIKWYQFYAGTPSSLFVSHCLKFDFYLFLNLYVQCYVAKNRGGGGVGRGDHKLIVIYAPFLGLSNGASFMLAPPL